MKTKKAHFKTIKNNYAIRFFAWGLLAFFMVNVFFIFVFFEVERSIIKHEVKHGILSKLPDNQLVSIEKSADFDENEFELNGKMYDVVRAIKVADKILLLCYEDSKETLLNQKIETLIQRDLAQNPLRKAQQKLIDFLQQIYIFSELINFDFNSQTTDNQSFIYKKNIHSAFIFVVSPPPKF